MRKINLNNKSCNEADLEKYGFINGSYEKKLNNYPFIAKYEIIDNNLLAKLIDIDTNFEYNLVDVMNTSYSALVNEEYEAITNDILTNCFSIKENQKDRILNFVINKYNNKLENLWPDTPDCGIIRHADNKKWYFVLMNININKIVANSNKNEFIIVLRSNKEKDNINIFPGFHMNKKNWITIILDDRLNDKEIFELIKESFELTK